jgi:AcrR family transcriptional regulator
MGKPARRRLTPEARKLEIVEAAERLIAAHGAAVRVEDIVREAGVAKGTFFLYFPSWDDLLDTIRARLVATFDAANPQPTEADGPVDLMALVISQAEAFIDFTLSRRKFGEAIFHTDFNERRPLADNGIMRIAAAIRAGQEAGSFGPVDPEPTARLLFAAIDETADVIAGGADRDKALAALKTLMRKTLAP